jgi:hypothetical protein
MPPLRDDTLKVHPANGIEQPRAARFEMPREQQSRTGRNDALKLGFSLDQRT